MIYVIGSLKNHHPCNVANELREHGYEVFDDWHATSPDTDKYLTAYERGRGRNMRDALRGKAAQNQFKFDKAHLNLCRAVVLVMPAGKSGHMELGFVCGLGKPAFVLLERDPDEFDLMYAFCFDTGGDICYSVEELLTGLRKAHL